jgi:hypothetical protein
MLSERVCVSCRLLKRRVYICAESVNFEFHMKVRSVPLLKLEKDRAYIRRAPNRNTPRIFSMRLAQLQNAGTPMIDLHRSQAIITVAGVSVLVRKH